MLVGFVSQHADALLQELAKERHQPAAHRGMTRKGAWHTMSGNKFAWQKMAAKKRGMKAARDGSAVYRTDDAPHRPKEKAKAHAVVMPYGKFKGKRIDRIPLWYLRWMADREYPKRIKKAVLAAFKNPCPSSESTGQDYVPSDDKSPPF